MARRPVRLGTALAIGASGLVFLVGRSGSPAGQVGRVLAVVAVMAVATLALRRGPPGLVAGWSTGAVLSAAGLGIGVPHLVKDGSVAVVVAATVCLGAGLVLLVGSAVRAVAGARRGGRPLVALGIVPTIVVLWILTIAVAATNVPPTEVGRRTPRDVGLAYETVRLDDGDGPALSAWYVPSRTGAAVVLLHGAGSTRSTTLDHAAVLAEHGYGVLVLDARGHGRSEGAAMDLGWWGDDDVGAATAFLAGRPDVDADEIGAVGLSMGAEEALGALGTDPRLRVVVAEGATGRVAGDHAWLVDAYGWRGRLQRGIDEVRDLAASLLTSAPRPRTLRSAVRPAEGRSALVIAAGSVPDEVSAARDLDTVAPDVVEVWVVPGAGHTGGLEADPDEWERRVVAFLDQHLDG